MDLEQESKTARLKSSPSNKMSLLSQNSNDSGYNTQSSTFSQESLTERLSESFISNESKRKYEFINKTPSKFENSDFILTGKSPLRSGGKSALQHLWASVSRLSPKMSPVEKKPNLGTGLSAVSATSSNATSPEALCQSTPFESTKQIKRVLFKPPTSEAQACPLPTSILPGQPGMVFPKQTSFNKFCEKTNALFRLPLANSPKKKGQQTLVNNIIDEDLKSANGKLVGLFKSKTGEPFVDFVTEFSCRDMEPFLLKFLTNDDLFCFSLVSRNWNSAVSYELESRKTLHFRRQKLRLLQLSASVSQDEMENFSPFECKIGFFHNSERKRSTSSLRSLPESNARRSNDGRLSDTNLRPTSESILGTNKQLSDGMLNCQKSSDDQQMQINCDGGYYADNVFSRRVDLRKSREDKIVKCPSCCGRAIVTAVREEGQCHNEMCRFVQAFQLGAANN